MQLGLNSDIAQRIVSRISEGYSMATCVTDTSGVILASTEPTHIGRIEPIALRSCQDSVALEEQRGRAGETAMALPLVIASRVLGALVLCSALPFLDEIAQMARMLAELILYQMNVVDDLSRHQDAYNTFVFNLLYQRVQADAWLVQKEAAVLGIDLTIPRLAVVFALLGLERSALEVGQPRSSLPAFSRQLLLTQQRALVEDQARSSFASDTLVLGWTGLDQMVALVPIQEHNLEHSRARLVCQVESLLDSLAQCAPVEPTAGIGRYYPDTSGLARSFRDAQFACDMGARVHGTRRAYFAEQLGLANFVCSDSLAEKQRLAQQILRPLADQPYLLETLNAFLDANLSPSAAARALNVHRHTLTQRLDKITSLTQLDPRHIHDSAQLYAALLLNRTASFSA